MPSAWDEAETGLHATQQNDPKLSWEFRLLEAEILLWQAKNEECLALMQAKEPEGLSNDLVVRTRLARGRALSKNGDINGAEARLAEAERQAVASNPELLGEIKLAEGGIQYDKDKNAAINDYQQALQLARKYHETFLESEALGSLSRVSTSNHRYDQAVDFGIQSLQRADSIGARHVAAATGLNLGWVYLELGDFQQAVPLFKACDETASRIGLRAIDQKCLNSLGRVFFNERELKEANDYFNRALTGSRSHGDESDTAVYLNNLALVAVELGKLEDAVRYNQECLEIQIRRHEHVEELRSRLTTAIIDDARKEYGKAKPILDSIIADRATEKTVRWEARDELANLYVTIRRPNAARKQFEQTLAELESVDIRSTENKLAFSRWASGFYTHYIGFLVDLHDYAGALRVAELMRSRTLKEGLGTRQSEGLNLSTLQSVLGKKGQIALDYWISPRASYLWAITPKACLLFPLPRSQEIESKIERYQSKITNLGDVERGDEDGQDLYKILIAPAQKVIPAGARIVIIPDGNLGKLNFETLLVPGSPSHFWVRDVQLEEASSLPLFMKSDLTQRPNPRLLVIGDPIQASPDYPRLVHARDEMQSAAEPFPPPRRTVVSGAQAMPSAYKANNPGQFDLIHFATHGIASDTRPLDSAIILSPDADGSFKLYARDIANIHLNAELVTISACYGAGERTYSGQGLVGLAWAFLQAGAHQVIAGLWKVDDQSTPQLMKDFYSQFQEKTSVAEALRSAKLKMLDSRGVFRLPYYWASLQLYTGSKVSTMSARSAH